MVQSDCEGAGSVILPPLCGKRKPGILHGKVHQPPKEKCDEKACAEEPKPPRFTLLESVVPAGEWLEESLL